MKTAKVDPITSHTSREACLEPANPGCNRTESANGHDTRPTSGSGPVLTTLEGYLD